MKIDDATYPSDVCRNFWTVLYGFAWPKKKLPSSQLEADAQQWYSLSPELQQPWAVLSNIALQVTVISFFFCWCNYLNTVRLSLKLSFGPCMKNECCRQLKGFEGQQDAYFPKRENRSIKLESALWQASLCEYDMFNTSRSGYSEMLQKLSTARWICHTDEEGPNNLLRIGLPFWDMRRRKQRLTPCLFCRSLCCWTSVSCSKRWPSLPRISPRLFNSSMSAAAQVTFCTNLSQTKFLILMCRR